MSDNNNKNGELPDWVKDAQSFEEKFQENNKEAWFGHKSITFDYEAQLNLPNHVKSKMIADRFSAKIENKGRISKIEKILNDYRRQEDFSDYRLAAYIVKNCMENV